MIELQVLTRLAIFICKSSLLNKTLYIWMFQRLVIIQCNQGSFVPDFFSTQKREFYKVEFVSCNPWRAQSNASDEVSGGGTSKQRCGHPCLCIGCSRSMCTVQQRNMHNVQANIIGFLILSVPYSDFLQQ